MTDKHACSTSCPCQQGRDKAIVERVVGRVINQATVERVASRYLRALDIGRGAFGDHLKIHHFRGSLEITDMANAGKRGKKVRIMNITATGHDDEQTSEELLQPLVSHILHMTYDQAKKAAEEILQDNEDLPTPPFRISEREVRGIDVEPRGTTINLEKKFPDGSSVQLKASPHDFLVTHKWVIKALDDEGKPKPAHGQFHDTHYHSSGRESGIVFYAWLKDNLSKASHMNMQELTKVWDQLGAKWDSR